MIKAYREAVKIIKEEGGKVIRDMRRKRHSRLVVRNEESGATFVVICAGSPGDVRSLKNFRAEIRRKIRNTNTDQ